MLHFVAAKRLERGRLAVVDATNVDAQGRKPLIELANLTESSISAEDVGFRLTPRLNAAGRLGDAQLALDLLLAPNEAEATRLIASTLLPWCSLAP